FTITITPVNDAPVAFADQAATTQGVAVIIPVLANDTDVDGSTLTVTGVSASAGATVGVNADGTVTYRPAADFVLLNQHVNITVASNGTEVVASLANPLRVTFTLDASAIPANETIASIQILRNDQVLTECAGATAIPAGQDPCISS